MKTLGELIEARRAGALRALGAYLRESTHGGGPDETLRSLWLASDDAWHVLEVSLGSVDRAMTFVLADEGRTAAFGETTSEFFHPAAAVADCARAWVSCPTWAEFMEEVPA